MGSGGQTLITFTVAGKAMGKERVRFVRQTGRAYTPERTLNYEARVAAAGQLAMADTPLLDGPLRLTLDVYAAVPQSWSKKKRADALSNRLRPVGKPDADNLLKSVSDGLNLVVWTDDSQIVDAHVRKWYSDAPRVVIAVQHEPTGDIFQ